MTMNIKPGEAQACYELSDHLNDVHYSVEKIYTMLSLMLDGFFFLDEVKEEDLPGMGCHYEHNKQLCNIAQDYVIAAQKDLKRLIEAGNGYFTEHSKELVADCEK